MCKIVSGKKRQQKTHKDGLKHTKLYNYIMVIWHKSHYVFCHILAQNKTISRLLSLKLLVPKHINNHTEKDFSFP